MAVACHPRRLVLGRPGLCALGGALALLGGLTMPAVLAAPDTPSPPAPADCQAALAKAARQQADLQRQAAGLAVLLLAEIHTSSDDHAWQLRSLETLHHQRPLVLALEMVPAARQPALDRFNRGEGDETALLRRVDWSAVWGHDPALYLPLLRWARRQGVPLLALNAEPALVRQVRQRGWAALTPAQRQSLGPPAPPSRAYRQRLEANWLAHRPQGLPAPNRTDQQRFIDSQLLRDRTMAVQLARAHRRDPTPLLVALIGSGHLEGNDGVPQQLQALGLRRQLSLQRPALPEGCLAPPRGARLGAYLESDPSGVWVRQVAPGSAAATAGLRPGDRILELNGLAVQRAGQVIQGARLQPDGLPLRLTIDRQGRRLELELRLPPAREPGIAARDNGRQRRTPS